jgi:hypothetical protein
MQKETSMSSPTRTLSMHTIRRRSNAELTNAAGLVMTAAAMLLQIAAGSTLYPSLTGPIVLVIAALAVTFVASRRTAYVGLAVPLVLSAGAIVAAAMTGAFIDQLTDARNPGLLLGSILHVVGLAVAVAGGVGAVMSRRTEVARGR